MPITFPTEAGLRDARRVTIRPFQQSDVDDLFSFFQGLPDGVRRNAWDRIDRREVVEGWAREMDHDRVVSLLALDGSRIVADATMHYRKHGPLRLVGRLKWLLDPEYRRVGLGVVMVNTLAEMARDNGLKHVTCMLMDGIEDDAVETLRSLGFDKYVLPGYGTDAEGNPRDMVKMVLPL